LTPAQALAVEALAAGRSKVEAAEAAGVTRQTIHEWMKGATFMAEVDRAASELATATRRALAAAVVRSVDYVHEVVGDENAPPPLRARIALGLVGLTARSLVETPGVAAEQQGAASALLEQIADAAMPAEVRAWIRANPGASLCDMREDCPGGFLELLERLEAVHSCFRVDDDRDPYASAGWHAAKAAGWTWDGVRRGRAGIPVDADGCAWWQHRPAIEAAEARGWRFSSGRPWWLHDLATVEHGSGRDFEAAGPSGSLDDLE
jgi:DNA-binding XRE family transcriptional regulator